MLVDTNVLLQLLQAGYAQHAVAMRAFELFAEQGKQLHIVPQNLVELWVVATRPIERNGPGFTPRQAAAELERAKDMFELLPDTDTIYPAWETLVTRFAVSGKPSHDARLVAAMQVHKLIRPNGFLPFSGDRSGASGHCSARLTVDSAVFRLASPPL